MEILIKAAQLILSLSMLVFVHELGHFMFARLFKTRVDKFYLFFDIKFALFRFRPKNSEAEYGIGWFPLGGYCKISGMIDESMDTEHTAQEPQPYEYRSKPARQRLFIMTGGVLFNVIFAFFVYTGMLAKWGDDYLSVKDSENGIACDSVAKDMGFKDGDKIVALNGKPVEKFDDIQKRILLYRETYVTIERDGRTDNIEIDYYKYASTMTKQRIFVPLIPFIIDSILVNSINADSGLRPGDIVAGINDVRSDNVSVIRSLLPEYKGQTVNLTVLRNNDTLNILAEISDEGMLEVILRSNLKITEQRYNLLTAFPAGIKKAGTRLKDQLYELRLMITPKTETYKQVGSIIAIGNIYSPVWDWYRFWDITALLSIMLAVINLLPIPALDGGHVLFLLFEIITRRKPSEKFLIYAQMIGMIILLTIMALTIGNDLMRYVFKF